jgi:hypothetical protein
MTDVIGIIDRVLAEHKVLLSDATQLVNITNDASALMAITRSKEVFMPGRTDQVQGLAKFDELSNKVQKGLTAHFDLEETLLLDAVIDLGNNRFIEILKTLLFEHKNFKIQMQQIKAEADELINGQLSRALWEPKAYELRAHITSIQKQLEHHANGEKDLLNNLRKELSKTR